MSEELLSVAEQIRCENLRNKVKELIRDPPFEIKFPALPLAKCPAGVYQHHSYIGGLVEHTLCVVKLTTLLCDIVEEVYGGNINKDYVIAGALLHDIMKVYCYEQRPDNRFRTSKLGGQIDHLTLLVAELYKREFPLELLHIIASHHGESGQTKPRTVEALIVSIADMADSDLNNKILRGAEYILRRTGVRDTKLTSAFEALRVLEVKTSKGWKGIQELFGQISDPKI
jgi:7,8-dihydroneopterin 2',3'-cyclic phosphate phosphodiesterase